MKTFGVYLLGLVIGVLVVYGYGVITKTKVIETELARLIAPSTPFPKFQIATPPSQSLVGEIASSSGSLMWESRIATAPSKLKSQVALHQGSRLQTEATSSASLNFVNKVKIEMEENSDIEFVQTLQVDFVVTHRNGKMTYTSQDDVPISIRIRNALLTIAKGSVIVEMQTGVSEIMISPVGSGAKIGFNDTEIISQVYTLDDGEVYEYNSDERTAVNVEKIQ